MDSFAQLEHVDQLKNHFLPKIAKFAADIDAFTNDLLNIRVVVWSLDESLSLKCNKSTLLNFEHKIRSIFISHEQYQDLKDDNAKAFAEAEKLLGKLSTAFDDSATELNLRIDR